MAIGLGLVVVQWGMALVHPPQFGDGAALSTLAGATQWGILVVAALLIFFAVYGCLPDKLLLFIPMGVMLNVMMGSVTVWLHLPFYLDTVGTMLAAIVGGPLVGVVTAMATTLTWGVNSPLVLPYAFAGVLTALSVGLAAGFKRLPSIGRVLSFGALVGFVIGSVSAITVIVALDGAMLPGSRLLADFFLYMRQTETSAIVLQSLTSDVLDKIFSLLAATLAVRLMPAYARAHFVYWGNQERLLRILRQQRELDTADVAARLNSGGFPAASRQSSPGAAPEFNPCAWLGSFSQSRKHAAGRGDGNEVPVHQPQARH